MIPIHRIIHLSPLLFLLLLATTTTTVAQDEVSVRVTSGNQQCEDATKISAGKYASIHYTATIDESSVSGIPGDEFDSSYNRRIPFNFQLGTTNLLKGLELGVNGLCQGSQAIIVIPPSLGYGSHGLAPADATIRFEIDVLDVSNVEIPKPEMVIPDPTDEDDDENQFEALDTDGDGVINKDEMAAYYHSIGHDDYGGTVFELEDTDGDGYISWEEFHGPKGKDPPSSTAAHESMEVQLVSAPGSDSDNDEGSDQDVINEDEVVQGDGGKDEDEGDEVTQGEDEDEDEDEDDEILSDDEWSYEDDEVNEFLIIDENADGNITKEEMVDYYKSIGHTDFDSIDEIFRIEDANGDGVISWSEFSGPKGEAPPADNSTSFSSDTDDIIAAVYDEDTESDHEGSVEENYEESPNQFEVIDTNGDGKITFEELEFYYESTGIEGVDIDAIMQYDDLNNDGHISWDEFTGPKGDSKPEVTDSDDSDEGEVISMEEYPELFAKIDTNSDGHLDKHELKVFFDNNDASVLLAGKAEGVQIAEDEADSEDGEEGVDWEWEYTTASPTLVDTEDTDEYASSTTSPTLLDTEDFDDDYNSTSEASEDDYNSTSEDSEDEYEWEYYTEEPTPIDEKSSVKGLRGISNSSSADDVEVEEVIQLDMFHDIDANADNAIDKQEYMDYFAAMGMEMDQVNVDEIFALQDLDGDGVISWDEYQGPKGETEQDT